MLDSRDSGTVKTGTNLALMSHPVLIPNGAKKPEPMYKPREGLDVDMANRDLERAFSTKPLLNRTVYEQPDLKVTAPISPGDTEVTVGNVMYPYLYQLEGHEDLTLQFESRFECGNLKKAVQVYQWEYDLTLRIDTNTKGHTQWYYFTVTNVRKDVRYKFNIVNFLKPASMYSNGMQPLMYSEFLARDKGIGWHRVGEDICYYSSPLKRKGSNFYTLTFQLEFPYGKGDTCCFAYCFPYSYSDLQMYLEALDKDSYRKQFIRRRVMCQTLAGNNFDLLTITKFAGTAEEIRRRKAIVFTSRVHPGETPASFIMKGILDFLTGSSLEAHILRENFVFKVIPMLNPDGVILGNHRTNTAGYDLNRQWANPFRRTSPTIFVTKQMIKKLQEERGVDLFVDIHGHSRKKNIFLFGCENKDASGLMTLQEKLYPRMLSKASLTLTFNDCDFKIQKSKETTARVVLWRELRIMNSFGMESSFAGSSVGRYADIHYTPAIWEEQGRDFCISLLDYFSPDSHTAWNCIRELSLLQAKELDTLFSSQMGNVISSAGVGPGNERIGSGGFAWSFGGGMGGKPRQNRGMSLEDGSDGSDTSGVDEFMSEPNQDYSKPAKRKKKGKKQMKKKEMKWKERRRATNEDDEISGNIGSDASPLAYSVSPHETFQPSFSSQPSRISPSPGIVQRPFFQHNAQPKRLARRAEMVFGDGRSPPPAPASPPAVPTDGVGMRMKRDATDSSRARSNSAQNRLRRAKMVAKPPFQSIELPSDQSSISKSPRTSAVKRVPSQGHVASNVKRDAKKVARHFSPHPPKKD
ncbi:putative Cytosolic carboxypeptidase Nna1 [Blattamonas nauphoetae]|uniref:Cytosolic carboxypeptidase Nna1 n=1 Tax=Blattamonas nauphoetae TaxID=2049346 RepID=A0ABQ9X826_9EUKA|nr:putative Cytosolic carboxypeptidase Nna1 [Blattamonas nauphoetae]